MPKNAEMRAGGFASREANTVDQATGSIPSEAKRNGRAPSTQRHLVSAILPKKKPVPHKVPASAQALYPRKAADAWI